MSALSDMFNFEKFHAKDFWERLKDDPKRLLLGVDPASTEIWNKILGRDDDPLVNQLGGPMGGGTLGLGSGGVFDRAEAEGINTSSSNKAHDLAEVVASIWGGAGAFGGLSNAGLMGGEGGMFGGNGGEFFQDPQNIQAIGGLLNSPPPQVDDSAHAQAVMNEQRKRSMSRGLF